MFRDHGRHMLRVSALCGAVIALAGRGDAQGLPTATLSGRVQNEGQGLPGVAVTARSAGLQGERTAITNASGDYVLVSLPPGEYTVSFALAGFQNVTRSLRLASSQTASLDAVLSLSSVSAEAEVVATGAEAISTSTTASTTFTSELTKKLPVSRTLLASVNLAPGVNANGPNGAVTISGAQSFENLYTVNGVVVQDNIRQTPFALFIEDAIQETTTSTAAISAEYGRFTGGVVNAITKSGGNDFSGSFRLSLTNDDWQARTPAGETLVDKITPGYEATFGGPVLKDRLWFFGAGRLLDTTSGRQTSFTAIPYEYESDEKRYEAKLTLTPFANHSLTGSYIAIDRAEKNYTGYRLLALDGLDVARETPQELLALNYSGVLSDAFFLEAQYASRKFTFEGSGSDYTDLIRGTWINDRSRGARYNSATFCGVCGSGEHRDNENVLLKGTAFFSVPGLGSHTLVAGYDGFSASILSNNFQSGSNYSIYAPSTILQNGGVYPVFRPGTSTWIVHWPIAAESQGTDLRTHSVFLNDSVRLSDRISLNLGLRYDKNDAQDSRGVKTADDSNLSPRLAAAWDVFGTGSLRVNASYGRYVAALQDNLANTASGAGVPAIYLYFYGGPGINTVAGAPLTSTADALAQLFSWFTAQGCPGPDCNAGLGQVSIPGLNNRIDGGLTSPNADELTLGLAGALSSKLSWRADVIHRDYKDFYAIRRDRTTGQVTDPFGQRFDIGYVENTNLYERVYDAFQLQLAYRPTRQLSLGGNWTYSHLIGNFVGETSGSGPIAGDITQYPEYKNPTFSDPRGSLDSDQRHKVRLYAVYDLPLGRLGTVSLSALQQLDTGTPYGAVGLVSTLEAVGDLGYATAPESVTYAFTGIDAYRTPTIHRTDLALSWSLKLGPAELFVQPQVINLFNGKRAVTVDQTVFTVENSADPALRAFNPFREQPVEGVNWIKGPNFGQPTATADYQQPRLFRVSFGVRF
ncbi:MAG: TonB-dependent receptor [Acidobacteria bacterium]|nr:TonB-dependent receptor [Acidobacteriota bacterium]